MICEYRHMWEICNGGLVVDGTTCITDHEACRKGEWYVPATESEKAKCQSRFERETWETCNARNGIFGIVCKVKNLITSESYYEQTEVDPRYFLRISRQKSRIPTGICNSSNRTVYRITMIIRKRINLIRFACFVAQSVSSILALLVIRFSLPTLVIRF